MYLPSMADTRRGHKACAGRWRGVISLGFAPDGKADPQQGTIYPQNVPAQYHLEVNSECSWSVKITEPPS